MKVMMIVAADESLCSRLDGHAHAHIIIFALMCFYRTRHYPAGILVYCFWLYNK